MNKYTTKLTADTTQHDKALKKSANEVYKYNKRVDEAKNFISGMGKKIPQLAAAIGVTTGAMAVFNKMVSQTQNATDSWGRFTMEVNGALDTLAYRMSGIGFGNFIDGLKESAQAAKDAYNALDELGTMTIFQDKATADYKFLEAQYERIIRNKKSTPQQIKDAEVGLNELRENYVKGQRALAAQAIKVYQDTIQAEFINNGVKVTNGFINKYLGSYEGFQQGMSEYYQLYAKRNTEARAEYYYDQNTGQKKYTGGHRPLENAAEEKRYQAFEVMSQISDNKLKEANAHYINARNIETGLLRDEIRQTKMIQSADNRINGNTKETARQINDRITEQYGTPVKLNFDIDTDTIIDTIDNAIKEKPITLELKLDTSIEAEIAKDTEKFNDWMQSIENTSGLVNDLGNAFRSLGGAFEMPVLDVTGIIAQSVATMIASYAQALKSVSLLGPWAWVSFGLTGLAQLGAMVEAVKGMSKFADGGIIGGNTTVGDFGLARVNAGEMVLNQREQTRLWNVLNGSSMSTNTINGDVRFEIDGSKLVGVLNNYNNKKRRVI